MTNGIVVEKVEIRNGTRTELFAAAFSKPNKLTRKYSLTFEAHLTDWTQDRAQAETWANNPQPLTVDDIALSIYGKPYNQLPDDGEEQDHVQHLLVA